MSNLNNRLPGGPARPKNPAPAKPEFKGPRHRKGGKLRYKNSEILGRVIWDPTHSSPWVVFKNITEYRTWATAIRKHLPGVKTEYMYFGMHTPATLMESARVQAKRIRSLAV